MAANCIELFLEKGSGPPVGISIRKPDKPSRKVIVIFHCFLVHKDWGFFPYAGDFFAKNGFICINVDFSHNGFVNTVDGNRDVDLFAQNTVTEELNDAKLVVESIMNRKIFDSAGINSQSVDEINFIGHSRGAGIALLTANQYIQVNKLVLWAPLATFDRWTDRQKIEWIEKGNLEFKNLATGEYLHVNSNYLIDIQKNSANFDLVKAAQLLKNKMLIIHGENDLTVKFSEAKRLISNNNPNEVFIKAIEKTGHTFGVNHPEKSSEYFEKVLKETLDFLINK